MSTDEVFQSDTWLSTLNELHDLAMEHKKANKRIAELKEQKQRAINEAEDAKSRLKLQSKDAMLDAPEGVVAIVRCVKRKVEEGGPMLGTVQHKTQLTPYLLGAVFATNSVITVYKVSNGCCAHYEVDGTGRTIDLYVMEANANDLHLIMNSCSRGFEQK